jgi:hypothetical protein
MDRALRVLAIAALLAFGGYFAASIALHRATDRILWNMPVGFLLMLVGQTAYFLAFAAGVAALVASVQRRQRGWAIPCGGLLLLAVYGSALVYVLTPVVDVPTEVFFYPAGSIAYVVYLPQAVPSLLLALVVLVYSFIGRPLPLLTTTPSARQG